MPFMVIYQKPAYFGELQITKFDTYARCHAYANVYYYRNSQRMIKKLALGCPVSKAMTECVSPHPGQGIPKIILKKQSSNFPRMKILITPIAKYNNAKTYIALSCLYLRICILFFKNFISAL